MTAPNKTVIRALQILRYRVKYSCASIRLPGSSFNDPPDTLAVQAATRLYVQSWILPLLDYIESGDTKMLNACISAYDRGDKRGNFDYPNLALYETLSKWPDELLQAWGNMGSQLCASCGNPMVPAAKGGDLPGYSGFEPCACGKSEDPLNRIWMPYFAEQVRKLRDVTDKD